MKATRFQHDLCLRAAALLAERHPTEAAAVQAWRKGQASWDALGAAAHAYDRQVVAMNIVAGAYACDSPVTAQQIAAASVVTVDVGLGSL